MIVATSKQKIKKNDVPISLFQKSCHTWTDKKKKKKTDTKRLKGRQAVRISREIRTDHPALPVFPFCSIRRRPRERTRSALPGWTRERDRGRGRGRERVGGGSYIGAFEVSRLLGIKSARPFTASSGCVAVSRLYPLQPASLFIRHPLPPSVRRERGHVRR